MHNWDRLMGIFGIRISNPRSLVERAVPQSYDAPRRIPVRWCRDQSQMSDLGRFLYVSGKCVRAIQRTQLSHTSQKTVSQVSVRYVYTDQRAQNTIVSNNTIFGIVFCARWCGRPESSVPSCFPTKKYVSSCYWIAPCYLYLKRKSNATVSRSKQNKTYNERHKYGEFQLLYTSNLYPELLTTILEYLNIK